MNLRREIDDAFANRARPSNLVEPHSSITPEQRDALAFAGRHWREIGWRDWHHHPDAFYAFLPEAFIFYLPSLLLAVMDAPREQLLAGDAFIGVLDRSPELGHWGEFVTRRLFGLEPAEYEAIKAWILSRSGAMATYDEDSLMRAYETVDLLALESEKLRQTLRAAARSDE